MDCTAAAYAMWSALRTVREQQCWDAAALRRRSYEWYEWYEWHDMNVIFTREQIGRLIDELRHKVLEHLLRYCELLKPISCLITTMTFMLRPRGATWWRTCSPTGARPIIRRVKTLYLLSSTQISQWLMSSPASHWPYCLRHSTVAEQLCSKGTSAFLPAILNEMQWPSRCRATVDREIGTPGNRYSSCCFMLVNIVNDPVNANSGFSNSFIHGTSDNNIVCAALPSSFDLAILQPDPNNVPRCAVVDTQLICKVQIIFTSLETVHKTLAVGLWYMIMHTATHQSTNNTTSSCSSTTTKQVDIRHHAINPLFKLNY